ncbi:nitrogen fixation protein NifM [Pseudomaricurvus sp. HS19]|uniref:nitrogen fixation protein NifM n=1 Tax=Pseudomaricurvus sp. HS19 TaxID=2692626 RepID=UPI00136CFC24|nr:nitrogen fixation protein NifM [Pseudomaricurvus sp. HS19]MYM62470.1 nitrogen fixation protein NifM [Pseudomaricurvus sp. HS19]
MSDSSSALPVSVNYRLLRIATDQFDKAPSQLDESQRKKVSSIAAKEYLLEQAVLSSPEASDIIVPPSQVDIALQQICERYESEEAFEEALEENNLSVAGLREALHRELWVEAVIAKVESRAPVVDETEVSLFYYMNVDRFTRPEVRNGRHILITINPEFPDNTEEAAKKRIALVQKRVAKNPERFAEQAMKHSECPTALQGGELSNIKAGDLYQSLETVFFAMQPGQVSEVLESPVGLHVLYCESVQAGGVPSYEEIADKLRESLQGQQCRRHSREWVQQRLRQVSAEAAATTPEKAVEETE